MPFNKAPNSWLTGYTFTSNEISFSLSGDYTTECQDAMGLIFRVTDEILKKYTATASADRPVQWESTAVINQPVQGSPNSLKTITNKFVLDAELFAGLATPSLEVTISTPDMVYTGFAYGAVSYTAPSGSSVTITYSADGGQTFSNTAPTARGSYIARIVATKDGRSGTARSGFSILKSTPAVTAGTDITLEYSSGTINTNFYSDADFTSVTSSNNAVVSVVSFTAGGAVVLQKNGVGQADITASTAETSEYYSAEGSKAVILTTKEATITAPTTLAISVANGLSQNFTFTTNFTLTAQRYALMEFESSDEDVATISKGSSYPPTIEIVAGGLFTITSSFPGDSEYGEATSTTSVAITGATPVQTVTVAKASSQASFSGDDGIVITPPESPATSPWESGKLWTLRIGLDSDDNGEIDGSIPTLPYVFTITIANTQGQQGTSGALSTSFTNYASNNWISFSTSGNTITGTISSFPTTINNGEVSGCSLFTSKAAADGVLAWQGQFDINVFKEGPSYKVMQSGLFGTMDNNLVVLNGSSVTLNANDEYTSDWNADSPHVAKIRIVPQNGAVPTGITASWSGEPSWNPEYSITFSDGSVSKQITANSDYTLNIIKGGSTTLNISVGSSTIRSVVFTIRKITPVLSLSTAVDSACCDSSCGQVGIIVGPTTASITLETQPANIGWSSPGQTRVSRAIVNGEIASIAAPTQLNDGKLKHIITPTGGANSRGDTSMNFTLAETDRFASASVQVTLSARASTPRITPQQVPFGYSGGAFANYGQSTQGDFYANVLSSRQEIRIPFQALDCVSEINFQDRSDWNPPLIILARTDYPFLVTWDPNIFDPAEAKRFIGGVDGFGGIIFNRNGANWNYFKVIPDKHVAAWIYGAAPGSAEGGRPHAESNNVNTTMWDYTFYNPTIGSGTNDNFKGVRAYPNAQSKPYTQTSQNQVPIYHATGYGQLGEGTFGMDQIWTNEPGTFGPAYFARNTSGISARNLGFYISNYVKLVRGVTPTDSYIPPGGAFLPSPLAPARGEQVFAGATAVASWQNFFNVANTPAVDPSKPQLSFAVYTAPTLPFRNGYVGDYYNMPGSPVTLTFGTDFFGNDVEGSNWSEFFSETPTIQAYKIGEYIE
jgi:hypothetical protein